MVESTSLPASVDPRNGFDRRTKIFHSLRLPAPLPPLSRRLSASDHAISLICPSPATPPPDRPAVIEAATGASISYSEFIRQIRSLAASLQSCGAVSKGDVVYILAPASLQIPVLYFALLSIGVVFSPGNPLSTPAEISRQIQLSRPKFAFATSETAKKLPSLPVIILDSPDFRSMISDADHRPSPLAIYQLDPAAILYSSGTTGKFKGVVLTQRNLIGVTAEVQTTVRPPTVTLFTVPLFHIFGLAMIVKSVGNGDTMILMERFDFEGMLKAIERYKVAYMPVAPPIVVAMAKSPVVDKYDLSSLEGIGCGGAPLGKEVAQRFSERFPHTMVAQGYGLTETSATVTRTLGPEECQRFGSSGRLTNSTEAKIVDPENGEAMPPGKFGEIWVRGPGIMKGYRGDDEATAAVLDSDGWLKTGDLGYFDEDGFLFIVDRLKELIKYKGYQVAPAELEALLLSHPEVADVAVIPYPDEETGEIPMAYVVRQPNSSPNEAQLMDFVAKQVAPYKKIRRVAFISAIPKSVAGKILRRELVQHATSLSKL